MDYRRIYSINLLKLIDEHGMTVSGLAKKIGVGANTMYHQTEGLVDPSVKVMIRVADCFGVSMDWLIGRSEER